MDAEEFFVGSFSHFSTGHVLEVDQLAILVVFGPYVS